jgi:putative component of membrane protein insertase Oxa1/YidC/SpoIIIJ protein YidD
MKWVVLVLLFSTILVVLLPVIAAAEETAYDVLVGKNEEEDSAVDKALRFYQENISSHDGARCLFYPTCSHFAAQAIKEYGLFQGVLMTIDRMVYREDPLSLQYYSYDEEKNRYQDPVHKSNIFNEKDYLK